jgi:arylformamidase
MLYDITRKVTPTLHVWPGDTPFSAAHVLRLEDGHSVNLTTLTLSAHTGTHADAYYHYTKDGDHPITMPLESYIGRTKVVTVQKRTGSLFPNDFLHANLINGERLLIHSHVSDLDDHEWPQEFPYLSVELVEWLASLDYKLIGLDSPSVDAFDSKDLPCHHAIQANGMVNLETLFLRGVPDGDYELIALPLKLDGACGSPVRAVLRTLD